MCFFFFFCFEYMFGSVPAVSPISFHICLIYFNSLVLSIFKIYGDVMDFIPAEHMRSVCPGAKKSRTHAPRP